MQRIAKALDLSLGDLLLYVSDVDAERQVLIDLPVDAISHDTIVDVISEPIWDHPTLHLRLLEDVQQAVIVTDTDGTIRYWNSYPEQLSWLDF